MKKQSTPKPNRLRRLVRRPAPVAPPSKPVPDQRRPNSREGKRKFHLHVKGKYIGTVETTESELRKAVPHITIYEEGGGVEIHSPPPRKAHPNPLEFSIGQFVGDVIGGIAFGVGAGITERYIMKSKKNPSMTAAAQGFISDEISALMRKGYLQDRAIAAAYSMARRAGYDVPSRPRRDNPYSPRHLSPLMSLRKRPPLPVITTPSKLEAEKVAQWIGRSGISTWVDVSGRMWAVMVPAGDLRLAKRELGRVLSKPNACCGNPAGCRHNPLTEREVRDLKWEKERLFGAAKLEKDPYVKGHLRGRGVGLRQVAREYRQNPLLQTFMLSGNPGKRDNPAKLLTKADAKRLPPIKGQENIADPIAYVKFFTPDGQWTWYVTEFDGRDEFFGLVQGLEEELGYFSFSELASIRGPMGLPVERDRFFRPTPLSKVRKRSNPRGRLMKCKACGRSPGQRGRYVCAVCRPARSNASGVKRNPTVTVPFKNGQKISVERARKWVNSTGDRELIRQFNEAETLQKKANRPATHMIWRTIPIGDPKELEMVTAMAHYGESPETLYKPPKGSKKGRHMYRHEWGEADPKAKPVQVLAAAGGKAMIIPLGKGQTVGDWMRG